MSGVWNMDVNIRSRELCMEVRYDRTLKLAHPLFILDMVDTQLFPFRFLYYFTHMI